MRPLVPLGLTSLVALASCSSASRSTSYADAVLADRPASYFHFDDLARGARDEQGLASASVIGGVTLAPSLVAGDPGRAFAFDGVGGGAIGPDVYGFQGTHPFTIEVWLRPAPGGLPIQRICNHRLGPDHTGWRLFLDETKRVVFERWSGDAILGSVGAEIPMSATSHVVARYDGATLALYVDGALRQSVPDARPIGPFSTALAWGSASNAIQDFFQGTLDEGAIYDVALPEDRIRAHYAAGAGK